MVSKCLCFLSGTFTGLDKNVTLLHNLYITNLLCFTVQIPVACIKKHYNCNDAFRAISECHPNLEYHLR
jgi:hypothetical protein